MEFNNNLPNFNDLSNHPSYTYGDLYALYCQFIDYVNGPIGTKQDAFYQPAKKRLEYQPLSVVSDWLQQFNSSELQQYIELWENPSQREKDIDIILARVQFRHDEWGCPSDVAEYVSTTLRQIRESQILARKRLLDQQ